jgi:hypothetical protein
MSHPGAELPLLNVSSFDELLQHEKEIVRRIRALSNGGHLLLLDPQRLLRDVGVRASPEVLRQTREKHPGLFTTDGGEGAYERVAKSGTSGAVRVTVNGLFPKETV